MDSEELLVTSPVRNLAATVGNIKMDSKVTVSVVVVNFNGGQLVSSSVKAVLESSIPVSVYVVDNGSVDGSLEALKRIALSNSNIHLIENRHNLGFAKAANECLMLTESKYVVLLNPDCIVEKDVFARMLEVLQNNSRVAVAGCLVKNPDGTEQAGCRRAVPTPWRTFVRVFHLNKIFRKHDRFRTFLLNLESLPREPISVEAISGAFMMVRRTAIDEIGVLDESYFLHCEDLDWCMRFRAAGWEVLFVPDVSVVHFKGTCSRSQPIFVEFHKHRGMIRFYRKFFRHQYPGVLMWVVGAAVWIRFGLIAGWYTGKRVGRFLGCAF